MQGSKLTEDSVAIITGLHDFGGGSHPALGAHVVLSEEMGRGNGPQHEGGDGRGAEGGERAVHGDGWVCRSCGWWFAVWVLNQMVARVCVVW